MQSHGIHEHLKDNLQLETLVLKSMQSHINESLEV
jgi:hypothetical protein